jgi:hypothetical protein
MTKVVFLVSRNKDNKHLPHFKERKETFFCNDMEQAKARFMRFVAGGQTGETCRLYVSVNARDEERVKKALVCRLVMDDNASLNNLETLAVSLAMKTENAAERKWLFDFDCPLEEKVKEFMRELTALDETLSPVCYPTKNGYAVVVMHGFNTTSFLGRWTTNLFKVNPAWGVELKRDAMLLYDFKMKE